MAPKKKGLVACSPSKVDANADMELAQADPSNPFTGALKVCVHCKVQTALSECTAWGQSNYSCKPCKSNYNRNMERFKLSPCLKRWFSNLTLEEKTAWYVKNKQDLGGG